MLIIDLTTIMKGKNKRDEEEEEVLCEEGDVKKEEESRAITYG